MSWLPPGLLARLATPRTLAAGAEEGGGQFFPGPAQIGDIPGRTQDWVSCPCASLVGQTSSLLETSGPFAPVGDPQLYVAATFELIMPYSNDS